MVYEYSVFKAPCEGMNKDFRQAHKALEKDINQVVGSIADMNKLTTIDKDMAIAHIDKLVGKLQGLKRKVTEAQLSSSEHITAFKGRVDHFKAALAKGDVNGYNQTRTDRVLVDYMLRAGYYDSAIRLATDTNITDLVDIDIFVSSKKVIEGLEKHDCQEALQWCAENRSKLKKINSELEFLLRIQEFIELARKGKQEQAIHYAQKYLAPNAATNMKEIQLAMAALAFSSSTNCPRYKFLFDEARWSDLVERFKKDNYSLHSLSLRPLLSIALQAGLSALKTTACVEAARASSLSSSLSSSSSPLSASPSNPAPSVSSPSSSLSLAYASPLSPSQSPGSPPAPTAPHSLSLSLAPTKNINCPVCNDQFAALAAPLPIALHSHSCLVCRVTGEIMNEDNPPMALPNGHVYSRKAIHTIAAKNNGKIVCPVTGFVCRLEEIRKVFIS